MRQWIDRRCRNGTWIGLAGACEGRTVSGAGYYRKEYRAISEALSGYISAVARRSRRAAPDCADCDARADPVCPRRPRSALGRAARSLARAGGASARRDPVSVAFLEIMEPDLPTAAARLVAAGCHGICIVPVFLGQGGHVRRDLAALLEAVAARQPRDRRPRGAGRRRGRHRDRRAGRVQPGGARRRCGRRAYSLTGEDGMAKKKPEERRQGCEEPDGETPGRRARGGGSRVEPDGLDSQPRRPGDRHRGRRDRRVAGRRRAAGARRGPAQGPGARRHLPAQGARAGRNDRRRRGPGRRPQGRRRCSSSPRTARRRCPSR